MPARTTTHCGARWPRSSAKRPTRGFSLNPRSVPAMSMPPDVACVFMTDWVVGGYHLQELLGAGGMGEVYRAHDSKLGRDVAIKVLPQALTSDPDRFARLEREARMLAALNHPNICAIYGLDDADGVRFLFSNSWTARPSRRRWSIARAGTRQVRGCRSVTHWPSRGRWPRRSRSRTNEGLSIAI